MADTAEESFPRGGVPKITTKKGEKRAKNDEIDLFKVSSTEPSEKKKTKRDKRRFDSDTDAADSVVVISIEKFSPAIVTDEMLLLGRISEIADYHMIIALPEGVMGKVSITDISDAYTDLLKKMANEDIEGDEFKPLDELFTIGQLVCCRVKEITSKGPKRKEFSFTLNPKLVHRDVDISKINSQTELTGSVSSQEDHGYTIDIGLPGLNAFVSNAEAAKYKHTKPLPVGLHVQCTFTKAAIETIKSKSGRVLQVKLSSDSKKSAVDSSKYAALNNLLPGTIVHGEVITSNPRGIKVNYLDKFQGVVHCHQLISDPLKFKPKQEVKLCILYHQPLLGVSYLSMLPHLMDPNSTESRHYERIREGDIIDSASVLKVEPKSGALLKLKNSIRGYLPIKFVHDTPSRKNFNDFPKTNIKCRVKKFDMMNNYAVVSCCKSFLDRRIMRIDEFIPGQLVEAVVKRFHSAHVLVRVGGCYRGFIPDVHNANVPLKHPEKKYAIDAKIRCRVLKIEDANRQSITLTAKETLVNTKLPMINSMDVLKRDMITEGVVVKIYPTGLLVGFYNELTGFVSKNDAVDDVNKLQGSFYVGQVVKCRVRSWDMDSDRIRLSFRLESPKVAKVDLKDPSSLDAKKIYSCQVKRIADKGLTVLVDGVQGFLPVHHISDNMVNCKHLLKLFEIDQEIDRVVLFEHGAVTPIFTMKQSILRAFAVEKPPADDIADLVVGMTVPGVVRNTVDWGVFVQLSHSLKGVAHSRFVVDGHESSKNAENLFKTGQSVDAHILETDVERNRINCSLRVSDCYQGDTAPTLDLLTSYLNERSRIVGYYAKHGHESIQKLTQFAVGSVIEVKIEQTNDYGSVGYETSSQSKAICTVFHMEGCTVKVGDTRKAVVLYQDFESKCLEVTMSKKIVSAIANRSDGPSNRVNEESTLDALVLLVKPEFVLVALRGRAEYKMAYAPAQKCLNDVTGSAFFEPGFSDKVEVKKVRDFVVCSWQAYEGKGKDGKTGKLVQSHTLSIGSEVIAVVKDILPFQMNIRVGAIPGRIFASEIDTDILRPGERLAKKFRTGQQLKAVVVGFRDAKSLKLMEFIGQKAKGMPECSIRKGRLDGSETDREFDEGDVVPGFYYDVQKRSILFRLSSTMNGRCPFLHSDFPPDVLNNPDRLHSGAFYPLTVVSRHLNICDVSMVDRNCATVGAIVVCVVRRIKKDSIVLRLPWKKRGTVSLTEMTDEYLNSPTKQFKVGQYVRGRILAERDNGFQVSLRESRRTPMPMAKQPADKIVESCNDLVVNEIIRGFVYQQTDRTVTILLGNGVYAVATGDFVSDTKDAQPAFRKNAVVTAKILKIGTPVLVSLRESDTGFKEQQIARKRRNSDRTSGGDIEVPARKRRLSDSGSITGRKRTESAGSDIVVCPALATRKRQLSEMSDPQEDGDKDVAKLPKLSDESEKVDTKVKSKTVAKKTAKNKKKAKTVTAVKTDDESVVHLDVNEGFAWVNDFSLPSARKNDSESSDDEEEPSVVKEDKKTEEKRLIELENRLLDSSRAPETEDEFDRLVVQSPDSSMIWLQYMAHHLKMAEIDKARTIAERALKSISFREEQEKLNVWAALMNLENSYGTPDQLKEVFDRAVQMNDTFKIHSQLVKIYESSDKNEQAERLYSTMVRQFGTKKHVWIDFATFYFRQNRYDSARKMLERGLKTMDKRDHMEVVTKFGRLEFEHGQNEQAIDLFERVLAECSKRLDVWNVYIDLLVKHATIEKVRRVFLKVVDIQFPAKKMKSVYKKWLDFETKHGDQSSVDEVKEKAAKYAQSNKID